MKIELQNFYGFCPAVKKCVENTLEIIKENPDKNIYLIGNIVHNKDVCNKLASFKNVKVLDDSKKSRYDLVDSIKTKNNIIIFSAHGTSPNAIVLAKSKGYKVYDFVCNFVKEIYEMIWVMNNQYHIAYYGIKDHPEAIAAKAYGGKNLTIYQTKKDLVNVLKHKNVLAICQTTMDYNAFAKTKEWFSKVKNFEFKDKRCMFSMIKQEEALNSKPYDIVFVVSDKTSHNGLALYETLKINQKNVYLVEPNEIEKAKKLCAKAKTCKIFSSTSVSKEQVDEFVKKLGQK